MISSHSTAEEASASVSAPLPRPPLTMAHMQAPRLHPAAHKAPVRAQTAVWLPFGVLQAASVLRVMRRGSWRPSIRYMQGAWRALQDPCL
jgi:hypothetical protein